MEALVTKASEVQSANSEWLPIGLATLMGQEISLEEVQISNGELTRKAVHALKTHDYVAAEIILATFSVFANKMPASTKSGFADLINHLGAAVDEACTIAG